MIFTLTKMHRDLQETVDAMGSTLTHEELITRDEWLELNRVTHDVLRLCEVVEAYGHWIQPGVTHE